MWVVPACPRMSSLENVSGANVTPSAVAVRVTELTVAPTAPASSTAIVIVAENANDPEPDSPEHCGLQRVAVIGLGRTETLNVGPFESAEVRPGGVVGLLLSAQAADMARTTAVRHTRID